MFEPLAACGPSIAKRNSLHGIDQRRQPLDAHLQTVARYNRANTAGRAGDNDIAGQEGYVRGNETHELKTVKDELAGVGVLSQLPILKKLDRQIVRIDFGFHIWPQRRESVE